MVDVANSWSASNTRAALTAWVGTTTCAASDQADAAPSRAASRAAMGAPASPPTGDGPTTAEGGGGPAAVAVVGHRPHQLRHVFERGSGRELGGEAAAVDRPQHLVQLRDAGGGGRQQCRGLPAP